MRRVGASLVHPGLKKVSVLSQDDGDQIWVDEAEFWSQLNGDYISFQYWHDKATDAGCTLSTGGGGVVVRLYVDLPVLKELRDVMAGRALLDRDVLWSVGYTSWHDDFSIDWVNFFSRCAPMPTEPYWLICNSQQMSSLAVALGVNNHTTAFGYSSGLFTRMIGKPTEQSGL